MNGEDHGRRGGASGTALITGASSGIGEAFARRLAAEGYQLVLVARRREPLAELSAALERDHPIRAHVLPADLAESAGLEEVADRLSALDDLALLINNAGFGFPGRFAATDPELQQRMVRLHNSAVVRLCRAALPGLIERNRGAIINVSSVAPFLPAPGSHVYAASKAFLNTFSEAVQMELLGTAVRIQALCPGYTETGFFDSAEYGGFDRSRIPPLFWMPAGKVVSSSLRALRRGRVIHVPGFVYKLLVFLARGRLSGPLIRRLVARKKRTLSRTTEAAEYRKA